MQLPGPVIPAPCRALRSGSAARLSDSEQHRGPAAAHPLHLQHDGTPAPPVVEAHGVLRELLLELVAEEERDVQRPAAGGVGPRQHARLAPGAPRSSRSSDQRTPTTRAGRPCAVMAATRARQSGCQAMFAGARRWGRKRARGLPNGRHLSQRHRITGGASFAKGRRGRRAGAGRRAGGPGGPAGRRAPCGAGPRV
jgi:hypothetical protein